MIRKILLVPLICAAVVWINLLLKEPAKQPQTQQTITQVEQQPIETTQPLPEPISEAEMEQLSPEDAEKDQ